MANRQGIPGAKQEARSVPCSSAPCPRSNPTQRGWSLLFDGQACKIAPLQGGLSWVIGPCK